MLHKIILRFLFEPLNINVLEQFLKPGNEESPNIKNNFPQISHKRNYMESQEGKTKSTIKDMLFFERENTEKGSEGEHLPAVVWSIVLTDRSRGFFLFIFQFILHVQNFLLYIRVFTNILKEKGKHEKY